MKAKRQENWKSLQQVVSITRSKKDAKTTAVNPIRQAIPHTPLASDLVPPSSRLPYLCLLWWFVWVCGTLWIRLDYKDGIRVGLILFSIVTDALKPKREVVPSSTEKWSAWPRGCHIWFSDCREEGDKSWSLVGCRSVAAGVWKTNPGFYQCMREGKRGIAKHWERWGRWGRYHHKDGLLSTLFIYFVCNFCFVI